MRQHKCGTCRFYQEARLASSGWCHHPQRKTTNDLMIMVRKNELACRDEWSHDLWEARSAQSAADAPSPELFPDRKMPPATESEIAALLQSERSPNGVGSVSAQAGADDVVLSELGAPSERPSHRERPDAVPEWSAPSPRPLEAPAPPPRISELGTRSAIIRARETYRERSRLEAARASEISRLTAKAEPQLSASEDAGLNPPVTAFRQDVDVAKDPVATQDPADQPAASSVDAVPSPLVTSETTIQVTSSTQDPNWERRDFQPEVPFELSSDDEIRPLIDSSGDLEPSRLSKLPELDTATVPLDVRPWLADTDEESGQYDSRHVARYDQLTTIQGDRASDEPIPAELIASEENEEWQTAGWHDGEDVVVGNDFDDDMAPPPGLDLAAHLPRICRTCRDFRPAENGERGWCANQWAFSHRRMVDADERTPCEGVLGNWWLPIDEVWSDAADVSSHGQPTPLLDAWLPQPQQLEPTRRRS